jgi:hypothetical protein
VHWWACCWWALGNASFNKREATGFDPWVHPSRVATASSASALMDVRVSTFAMRYWTCFCAHRRRTPRAHVRHTCALARRPPRATALSRFACYVRVRGMSETWRACACVS